VNLNNQIFFVYDVVTKVLGRKLSGSNGILQSQQSIEHGFGSRQVWTRTNPERGFSLFQLRIPRVIVSRLQTLQSSNLVICRPHRKIDHSLSLCSCLKLFKLQILSGQLFHVMSFWLKLLCSLPTNSAARSSYCSHYHTRKCGLWRRDSILRLLRTLR